MAQVATKAQTTVSKIAKSSNYFLITKNFLWFFYEHLPFSIFPFFNHETLAIGLPPCASHLNTTLAPSSTAAILVPLPKTPPFSSKIRTASGTTANTTKQFQWIVFKSFIKRYYSPLQPTPRIAMQITSVELARFVFNIRIIVFSFSWKCKSVMNANEHCCCRFPPVWAMRFCWG